MLLSGEFNTIDLGICVQDLSDVFFFFWISAMLRFTITSLCLTFLCQSFTFCSCQGILRSCSETLALVRWHWAVPQVPKKNRGSGRHVDTLLGWEGEGGNGNRPVLGYMCLS